jgi:hypothetical protein
MGILFMGERIVFDGAARKGKSDQHRYFLDAFSCRFNRLSPQESRLDAVASGSIRRTVRQHVDVAEQLASAVGATRVECCRTPILRR